MYDLFPAWKKGYGKHFRSVSYCKFGILGSWNVLKITAMQQLIRIIYHAWEPEQA
jgi:hypothetical protein